jgi:hypothetical protein
MKRTKEIKNEKSGSRLKEETEKITPTNALCAWKRHLINETRTRKEIHKILKIH